MPYFMFKKDGDEVVKKLFQDDEKAGKEWADCPTKAKEPKKKKETK